MSEGTIEIAVVRIYRQLHLMLVVVLLLVLRAGSVQAQVDAIFANTLQRNRVCLNNGTGALTCSDVSNDSYFTQGVALADVDGQNGSDALFANGFRSNRVCLNDGTGAFTCSDVSNDTNDSRGVAVADVDGQNGPDAIFANNGGITANNGGQRNRVCLNDGTGAFTCGDVSNDTNSTYAVALADVDGQNGNDAIFANAGLNRLCLNDGTGAFKCSDVSHDTNDSRGVALAPLNLIFADGFESGDTLAWPGDTSAWSSSVP